MTNHPNLQAPVSTPDAGQVDAAPSADVSPARPWQAEASALLQQVATMCIEHGVDVDTFMRSAWSTYVDARPGMREELEAAQLVKQLEGLREAGKIGLA